MPQVFRDLKNLWNSLINKKDLSKTVRYDPVTGRYVPIEPLSGEEELIANYEVDKKLSELGYPVAVTVPEGYTDLDNILPPIPTPSHLNRGFTRKTSLIPTKALENPKDYIYSPFAGTVVPRSEVPGLVFTKDYKDFINSMTDAEFEAFLDLYKDDEGNVDYKAIISDLDYVDKLPGMPDSVEDTRVSYDKLLADATAQLDPYYSSELADLKRLYDETEDLYNSQLSALNDQFRQSSSNLRSQQYLANAQTYDALRSDLRKSRQNALEAGASAGVRIASNVNALLTAQNKQSATAMETSNALAEMLLQHRNAVSGMTRDFANYKTDYNSKVAGVHKDYRTEARDNAKYAAEGQDYSHGLKLSQYDTDMKEYEDSRSNLNPGQSVYSNYQRNKSYLK